VKNKTYGVIFDMDGVLVDSYQPHLKSWQIVAKEFGHELSEQKFAQTFGRVSAEIIHTNWGMGISDDEIARFDRRKEAVYRDLIRDAIPAVPGLHDLLPKLAADDARIAVGSSGPIENVEMVLTGLAIKKYFNAIVSSKDVTRGKPDPQVFLTAAERLGVPADRCVVVEDAPAGIEAAHRAKMKVVGLTTSYSRDRISDADLICRDLSELSPEKIHTLLKLS
jgi:beta-phosphoglucomutase